jgi:hypothetical protein
MQLADLVLGQGLVGRDTGRGGGSSRIACARAMLYQRVLPLALEVATSITPCREWFTAATWWA